jgi:hypothetical protein
MSDNARNYRTARVFQQALADAGIGHLLTRTYWPQANGKQHDVDGGHLGALYTDTAEFQDAVVAEVAFLKAALAERG